MRCVLWGAYKLVFNAKYAIILFTMNTQEYLQKYDAATRKILEQATKIDMAVHGKFDAEYKLQDIASVLRRKFKDHIFRDKYVGDMPFMGFVPYPKGFCALSAICIYNLYGGDEIWTPSAIKLGTWEYAPVVYLQNRELDIPFDTTGDQFAPLRVPYELGTPINKRVRDMKTPNKEKFIAEIKKELDRR